MCLSESVYGWNILNLCNHDAVTYYWVVILLYQIWTAIIGQFQTNCLRYDVSQCPYSKTPWANVPNPVISPVQHYTVLHFHYWDAATSWLATCRLALYMKSYIYIYIYIYWIYWLNSSYLLSPNSLIIGMGCWVQVLSLILDSSVSLSVGIQSACDLVSETLGSNPAFNRGRQLVSFRFENRLTVPEHRHWQQQTYIITSSF